MKPNRVSGSREKERNTRVRPVEAADISAIKGILCQWVRVAATGDVIDSEVAAVLDLIRESIDANSARNYLVAEDTREKVIGMTGVNIPGEQMLVFSSTHNPLELINLYVDTESRGGQGVGTALYRAAKSMAKANGYTEIILNSGPRYHESGWGFYRKTVGEPIGTLKDYYGPGFDAPVWREVL